MDPRLAAALEALSLAAAAAARGGPLVAISKAMRLVEQELARLDRG